MTVRAVVFDFDGTLAVPTIDFAAMKRDLWTLARQVLPWVEDPGNTPSLEWIEALLADLSGRDARAAEALRPRLAGRVREIELEAASRGALMPFARPLLSRLRREGVGCAIITRNCAEAVKRVFPDAASLVAGVLTREDVPRVKPDPEHLLAALERLGVPPDEAAMVGDHIQDVQTGKRAGARAVGVLTGASTRDEFLAAGADLVVGDGADAVAALLGWDRS